MAIEADVENPGLCPVSKFPNVSADHHVVEFMTDYLHDGVWQPQRRKLKP